MARMGVGCGIAVMLTLMAVVGQDPAVSVDAFAASDAGVRLGAVRALNVFGAPARGDIPLLERIRDTDPDAQVRASAPLAIEAIRRAIRDKPQE